MSNTMYLVCTHHPEPIHACVLADRDHNTDGYEPSTTNAKLQKFLTEHKLCGGGFDHFTLAFARPKDGDLPKPKPLADVVHLTLTDAKGNA